MSRGARSSGLYAQHSLDANNIIFSMFTSDDIKKLCVTKICTPLAFDAMGYPLPGGLYDKSMGPLSEKSDPCGQCFKNYIECPGHFGYIDLPLPVVNPLFHKILQTVLKITCLSCFRLQIPNHVKRLIAVQMHLLDCGMVTEAREVELAMNDIMYENREEFSEQANKKLKKLEKMAKSIGLDEDNLVLNKTTESLRIKFLHGLLTQLKFKKKCIHCKERIEKLTSFRTKLMTTAKKSDTYDEKEKLVDNSTNDLKIITPEESRKYMRQLWNSDKELLTEIIPVLKHVTDEEYPTDIFYFETIPVPPPNVRPCNFVNNQVVEHVKSQIYKSILGNSMIIKAIIQIVQGNDVESLPEQSRSVYNLAQGSTPIEKLHIIWQQLQSDVDCLMDKDMSNLRNEGQGLKQIIEKKAGIIRMHMMGKRVNFAARSVITPDPNLNIDEIGIPEEFAKSLTYPVPVTSWNVEELRKMVMNGPKVHPGAVMVEFENGNIRINPSNKTQQESILKRLLTPGDDENKAFKGVKIVHRHLCNGDVLLLNRQPTLHRPSIMAHTARILKGEKTIRLHYANCKAYNADFDGDEMNAHFPQNELARSEGYTLANVCNQYLVPKDGTPLSGLIQDHMVSGVRMSVRGKFFSQSDYHQLVYQAIAHKPGYIKLLPPAIIKPVPLWSGKQILSTVIINTIPPNREPINLTATAKISSKAWVNDEPRKWKAGGTPFKNHNDMTEAEVIIRQGELLCGVLDKQHYGATPYGLIHCMYELYGGNYATKLLSSFAKLFTMFLQQEGFTLGTADILVLPKADEKRTEIIGRCRNIGYGCAASAVDVEKETEKRLAEKLEHAYATNPKFRAIIDRQYKKELDSFTNEINKVCLPAGLLCKFPHNNLQLMVQSGAKGSTVNTMQISCLLGQIELEGKRPPLMISGKSLPSFEPFDPTPRAGGFIDGRFMTGILPQEFFFHCMAGREGLIDTAVKTSRSGYLQRCLVKHLEGLKVGYDMTVRDSDKSVIQFSYGEDGMDISKVQFLKEKQLPFLADNSKAIVDEKVIKELKEDEDYSKLKKHIKHLKEWKNTHGSPLDKKRNSAFGLFSTVMTKKLNIENPYKIDPKTGRSNLTMALIKLWHSASPEIKSSFMKQCRSCPDPASTKYQPDHFFGSLTDQLYSLLEKHKSKDKSSGKNFENMWKLKAMQSLAAPGEPVGLLAAQSIGEPSTQMTLNTFHFAGRGEMNVTLGIPRLREILMMASANIKTPSMEVPFLNVPNVEKQAERLRKSLTRVTVGNVLEKIDVSIRLQLHPLRQHVYTLKFHFLPYDLYKEDYNVTPKVILRHMTKKYFGQLFASIKKIAKISTHKVVIEEEKKKIKKKQSDDEEPQEAKGDSSSEEEPEGAEEDAKLTSKFKSVTDDQEPEEEEVEKSESEDEESMIRTEAKEVETKDTTEQMVIDSYTQAQNYVYDKKYHLWCELTFCLPMNCSRVDLTAVLKDISEKSVIWETENIRRAITYMKDEKQLTLRTDGINITEMSKYNELLDLNKLYSNDIHKIVATYGIEAARKVIVKEVKDVFNVYGITVDPRHLLLIADYMTYNGSFEPLSRKGMECNASPLQQMSFESSLKFLKTATIQGKQDCLSSPSSCLMLGKPCTSGTGAFSLRQKIAAFVS